MLVLHLQQTLGTSVLRFHQQSEEVAHVLHSHIVLVEIEAQGEGGVGGLQMQGSQVVDWNLYLGGITDEFGSSWLFGNEELSSKNAVGWFWGLRMAEVVPNVVTGKEVGGQSEAGRSSVPGPAPSKPC